jgi:hypothetical protein
MNSGFDIAFFHDVNKFSNFFLISEIGLLLEFEGSS